MYQDRTLNWNDVIKRKMARLKFLAENQVNPVQDIYASMADKDGFGLPARTREHFLQTAMLRSVQGNQALPVDPSRDLVLGRIVSANRLAGIRIEEPFRMLGVGASGSGKTNSLFNSIATLRRHGKRCYCWEYKPELRRVIPYWKDSILFTPRTAPWQFLKPVGQDKLSYFIGIVSEMRQEFELRPETVPLIWQVIERMLRGMQPGDPPFCWEDLRRVLEHEAVVQKRENLYTLARAILNICVVLGPQAAAREVPELDVFFKVIGFNFTAQDPAILRLFLGFDFTRLLFQAEEQGHTTELRQVYVFDEGSVLFSRELMNRGVAQLSAAKRFVSMCRFAGTGFIICAQNLSQLDPFVTQNADVLLVFRCTSYDDAVLAAKMLGLEAEAVQDLMRLPTGVAYLRAAEWQSAVKIAVDLFHP